METKNENTNVEKQRHGCVTAWLVLMILANSITGLVYLLASEMITKNLPGRVPTPMIILLGLIGLGNVAFSFLLFRWKRIGFWGFVTTGVGAFIINLSIGLGPAQSVFGLVGIGILYAILQIPEGGVKAWDNLD